MKFVKTPDGISIAVYEINKHFENTIVLIHGWPLNHFQFEYQVSKLIEQNYRIVMIDLCGFGYSEETGGGYNYNQFANDIYAVVKDLELHNFTLLGFSMGGAISCRYMSVFDGYEVSKLILLDAAAPSYCITNRNPHGKSIEETEKLIDLGYENRPELNKTFGSIFFKNKQSEQFLNWFQNISNLSSGTGEMKSLVALRYEDCFDDLKRIHVPTLIIHGKEDMICDYKMAELSNENIKNSFLVPIENAGHGAFYEQKDAVNDAIIKFIGGE